MYDNPSTWHFAFAYKIGGYAKHDSLDIARQQTKIKAVT